MNKNVYVGTGAALVSIAALAGCANAHASPSSGGPPANAPPTGPLPAVVLVHGAFVDGSGWKGVYKILTRDGYPVTIVQNPTISLADNVAAARRAIAAQSGPVILVGHSYGGVVISEAGNDPKVAALVYVAAFAPDKGESIQTLSANPPPGAPEPPFLPPQDGFVLLDRSRFAAAFAADVDADDAAFMAASQVPCGVGAISGAVATPAWRTKPSWYLLTTTDKMIPPAAQHSMAKRAGATVTEVAGNHAIFVSKPDVVASAIERAAAAVVAKRGPI
jgi:pimeloyl-ACP methyl ester carboxylesterase